MQVLVKMAKKKNVKFCEKRPGSSKSTKCTCTHTTGGGGGGACHDFGYGRATGVPGPHPNDIHGEVKLEPQGALIAHLSTMSTSVIS